MTETHSTGSGRVCKNCEQNFTIEPDDFGFYKKIDVPPPTLCPQCRCQRLQLFRNERTFYRRICDLCKRTIISSYRPGSPFPVYCVKCWWSDKWDPYSYARNYDPSRPFLTQLKELFDAVPAIAMMNDDGVASTNSEYTYDWAFNKNSYMAVCGWHNENVSYTYHINFSKDVSDSFHVEESELMYECIDCYKSYNCQYCTHCWNSRNCFMGFDLRDCSDCVFSVNLRHKQFCIFNEKYSEAEYRAKLHEMGFGTRRFLEENLARFEQLRLSQPHAYAHIRKSVDTTGNILRNCKNTRASFYQNSLENCRYMTLGDGAKDSYDCINTGHPELCYNSVTPDHSIRCIATIFSWKCTQVEYSNNCHSSEYLLGCSALKKGSYSILNKKYSKEEFITLRNKIVTHMKEAGEWGEFFPTGMNPYAYNETAAQEWFPLTKDEAIRQGYRWLDPEARKYDITIKPSDVLATIDGVGDGIAQEVIGCAHEGKCNEKCTTAFKVIPQELQLYRRMKIPLPTLCGNCRHYARLKRRPGTTLFHRQCMCESKHSHAGSRCPNEFETSYAPDRPEIIYCEQCYNAETV